MPRRASLSDWYDRPIGNGSSLATTPESGSPLKCTTLDMEAFYIGERGSDTQSQLSQESPRKKRLVEGGSADEPTMLLLRGICADYFENNVTPIFKCIQQSQSQLSEQLKELAEGVERKANIGDVASREDFNSLAARGAAAESRVDEVAAAVTRVASAAQQEQLEQRLRAAEEKVAALAEELIELKKSGGVSAGSAAPDANDMVKLKAAFVTAGMRYEKTLKEIRAQVQSLQNNQSFDGGGGEPPLSARSMDARWPGRGVTRSRANSIGGESDKDSDTMSSVTESFAGSLWNAEEKAELQKIRTVVHAAGTMVAKDLKDVRSQVRELRSEVDAMRRRGGA